MISVQLSVLFVCMALFAGGPPIKLTDPTKQVLAFWYSNYSLMGI